MDNNANNNRKIIIRPRRKLGFLKAWLLLGIVMMLLNATIWPEVSTDPNICWFYQVATLWITMVNKVCQFFYPALQTAGNWLTNLVINIFEWIGANWSTITSIASKGVALSIAFFLNLIAFTVVLIVLCAIAIGIIYLLDKKEAKQLIEDMKTEIKNEWNNFCNKLFHPEIPEGEAISKTPTVEDAKAGSSINAEAGSPAENGAE